MQRTITIRPVLNGFICEVGCQTIVFESKGALMESLASYLTNASATEKKFIEAAVNPEVFNQPAAAEQQRPHGLRDIIGGSGVDTPAANVQASPRR